VYFVTLAIVEEDTQALFGALAGGLDDAGDPLLVVRTHPNRPQGDPALTAALARVGPGRAVLMNPGQDIYDHIVAADALICIGSMIAFEAIALDRMPIVFENPSSFPALSLAEFSDGLFVARDEAEMRAALRAVEEAGEEVRAKRRRWPDLLRRVLGDLETPLPVQLTRALARLDDAPRRGANPEPAPEAGVS
jgi:curved DNA-binding protein CbpA